MININKELDILEINASHFFLIEFKNLLLSNRKQKHVFDKFYLQNISQIPVFELQYIFSSSLSYDYYYQKYP